MYHSMSGLIRCAMNFTYPVGVPNVCVMTYHVNMTGIDSPVDADVDDCISAGNAWWSAGLDGEAALKTFCGANLRLDKTTGQKIQPAPAAAVREIPQGSTGTGVGSSLPPQSAVVISLRSNLAGRSYRGRMYVPGILELQADDGGALLTPYAQGIADSADGFRRHLDTLFGGDGELCVYSRKLDHKERVVRVLVGNRVDSQRRRKILETSYLTGV